MSTALGIPIGGIGEVVEVEVLGRQQREVLNEVDGKQFMAVALPNQFRRGENYGQEFGPFRVADGAHPAEMIQANIVEPELERVPAQRFGD